MNTAQHNLLMNPRNLLPTLRTCALPTFTAFAISTAMAATKPNFVVILADDNLQKHRQNRAKKQNKP
jgi:hypothetical protein